MSHPEFRGGNVMRQLNLHEIYVLGTRLAPLSEIKADTKKGNAVFRLWQARSALKEILREPSPLMEVAKRAARNLVTAISDEISEDVETAFKFESDEAMGYGGINIGRKKEEFESVLSNEMPGVPSFIVLKKGIYDTADLIFKADCYFPENILADLTQQARKEFCEAGKALAYELPTACCFHLWRSVETTMCAYYEVLTGNTVEQDEISRNWAAYIKALDAAKAEASVTMFLDHIRQEYRNPQTHPDEVVAMDDALSLFGAAASSINQLVLAIQKAKAGAQLALITSSSGAPSLSLIPGTSILPP
jgi:hypothetical protein